MSWRSLGPVLNLCRRGPGGSWGAGAGGKSRSGQDGSGLIHDKPNGAITVVEGQTRAPGVFVNALLAARGNLLTAQKRLNVFGLQGERLGKKGRINDEPFLCNFNPCHETSFQYPFAAATVAKWVATIWLAAISASESSA